MTSHVATRSNTVIAALGSIVVSVVSTLVALQTGLLSYESESTRQAYTRIAHLEVMVDDLTNQRGITAAQIARLEAQLEAKPHPLAALFRYIDAMETPAWLQMYYPEEDEFRMLYLNHAYERAYDVSRERYIDATNDEIYPPDIAAIYTKQDRQVLAERDFVEFLEPSTDYRADPPTRRLTIFWKFYLRLPDGREVIAGVQVGPLSGT